MASRSAPLWLPLLALAAPQNGCSSDENESGSALTASDGPESDGPGSPGPDTGGPPTADAPTLGGAIEGQFHLGPVDFAETEWHNACAPVGGYRSGLRGVTGLDGEWIAGVSNEHSQSGGVCDACILITTETGRSIVARVVTYGVEAEPGDIDVSPSVYEQLDTGEYPRSMNWRFASCPDTGDLLFEFQTEANIWWTSLWVRNPKQPIAKVEVKSANHADFFELRRETDGSLNDDGGFGEGEFTLRLTSLDGQVLTETFSGFEAGELKESTQQFE
jgi:hypothetical protein